MERYRYTFILFILLAAIVVMSSRLQAASDAFCANYAKLAVEQYQSSIELNCNFSGLRWSADVSGQKKWCLGVREDIASEETLARAEALIACKEKQSKLAELTDEEQNTLSYALTKAAANDDVDKIKQLIAKGADIHRELDGNFGTPLYAAIGAQAANAVKFFIEAGVDPQRTSNGGVHPINYLLQNDEIDYELLEYLLKHGVNPNGIGESGDPPLLAAIEKKDLRAVNVLLENGADANFSITMAETPLTDAIKNSTPEIVSTLLEHGADPNMSEARGSCQDVNSKMDYTNYVFPLGIAQKNSDMLTLLKQYGAKEVQDCIDTQS